MKAFTTLMKLCIMGVSVALVAMLVISAAPLVMGGIDVQNEEPIELQVDGTYLHISGKYVVESSVEQDISDLLIEAYLKSKDGSQTMTLISVGPKKIVKGETCVIDLNQDIPMAELAVFFITDNMGNEEKGIKLPINIHVQGTYSNNLAGLDMNLVYEYEVSETGQIKIDPSRYSETTDGQVSTAALIVSDIDDNMKGLIPDEANFTITIGGKELNLNIDNTGDDISLLIETGDMSTDSISSVIHTVLDAVEAGTDEEIKFTFNDEEYTVNPADVDSEQAQKYIAQIEGMMSSIDMFLDKYAQMMGPTGGA
jgi:hypothetical protein